MDIRNIDRYKDFILLNTPIKLKDLFLNLNYDLIQLHDITPIDDNENDIIGFCGVCSWKGNVLKSEDGDSYSDEMLIYGYGIFGNGYIDILVKEW